MSITLKAARVNLGLTQAEAAEKLGISKDMLSNYERYISFPSVPVIDKIVEIYGISYDSINFYPQITI